MTETRPILRLFLDEGAPVSVGRAFEEAGHEVIKFREAVAPASPDDLVCKAAELNGAILLAWDKDMKALASRVGMGRRQFRTLSLIRFNCRESRGYARAKEAMSLIEHEWAARKDVADRRIFIVIGEATITSHR